jgi:hypothetical protein
LENFAASRCARDRPASAAGGRDSTTAGVWLLPPCRLLLLQINQQLLMHLTHLHGTAMLPVT